MCVCVTGRVCDACWERGWTKTGNPKYIILNSQSSPRRGLYSEFTDAPCGAERRTSACASERVSAISPSAQRERARRMRGSFERVARASASARACIEKKERERERESSASSLKRESRRWLYVLFMTVTIHIRPYKPGSPLPIRTAKLSGSGRGSTMVGYHMGRPDAVCFAFFAMWLSLFALCYLLFAALPFATWRALSFAHSRA
jgi:hypothetical protein